MKTILAIMNTTYAVVKITPENKVEHCTGIKEVMGSNPFHYCFSSVHFCTDCFHIQLFTVNWICIGFVSLQSTIGPVKLVKLTLFIGYSSEPFDS